MELELGEEERRLARQLAEQVARHSSPTIPAGRHPEPDDDEERFARALAAERRLARDSGTRQKAGARVRPASAKEEIVIRSKSDPRREED